MDYDEPRTAILRAANRVMRKNGLHGTTVNAVAAEAGMTKGGLFYYFRNKRELLEATITRYEALTGARCAEIIATLPDEPGRLLRATVLTMLELMDASNEDMHSGVGFLGDADYQKVIGAMKKNMFDGLGAIVRDKDALTELLFILDGIWLNKLFSFYGELRKFESGVVGIVMELVDRCCRENGPDPS